MLGDTELKNSRLFCDGRDSLVRCVGLLFDPASPICLLPCFVGFEFSFPRFDSRPVSPSIRQERKKWQHKSCEDERD